MLLISLSLRVLFPLHSVDDIKLQAQVRLHNPLYNHQDMDDEQSAPNGSGSVPCVTANETALHIKPQKAMSHHKERKR